MPPKRVNVGILITPSDADIAAYLNSLRDAGQKPVKWLSGMLVANDVGEEFPIPDYRNAQFPPKPSATPPAPTGGTGLLFGTGASFNQTPGKWEYGWQVRGSKGEIIEGTVVSVVFCRPEVVAILNSLRENHLKIATYLKALMRHNMSLRGTPVSMAGLDQILRENYLGKKESEPIVIDPGPKMKPPTPEIIDLNAEKNPLLDYI